MKAVIVGTLTCAVALLSAAPCTAHAVPQTATAQSADALDSKITHRINADASLKKHDIKVSVDGSVATLSGSAIARTSGS